MKIFTILLLFTFCAYAGDPEDRKAEVEKLSVKSPRDMEIRKELLVVYLQVGEIIQ